MLFKQYFVYIMTSHSRVLYIGVTSNLGLRVEQHRACVDPKAFCTQYRIRHLVYFEEYQTADQAIRREKQMKRLSRAKKVALIDSFNPTWEDLAPTAQIPRRLRGSG